LIDQRIIEEVSENSILQAVLAAFCLTRCNRYPRRAESNSLQALLFADQQGDLDHAADILRRGLEQNAQPAPLLEYHLHAIDQTR
jgi:hypothetical protein